MVNDGISKLDQLILICVIVNGQLSCDADPPPSDSIHFEGQTTGPLGHLNDYGTEIPNGQILDDASREESLSNCCECVQTVKNSSPTGKSNVGRSTGPAVGVYQGRNAICTPGEIRTFKYDGTCKAKDEGEDCGSKTCDYYI